MPQTQTIRLLLVPLLILTSIFKQEFIGIAASKSSISEERLKEIAKIRAELNDALETEQENFSEKGVIVQPSWTQQDKKTDTKIQGKVLVTKTRIEEVKALREEIKKAIPKKDANVEQLVKEFVALGAKNGGVGNQDTADQMVGTAKGSGGGGDELVGSSATLDNDADQPNLVEAISLDVHREFDVRKLQDFEFSKRRMRETLILKSVEEDFTFDLGEDVLQWAHILHNGSEYFVGRREHDLLIVRKESATYEAGTLVEVGQAITYLHTYSFWNVEQAQTEGVTLVAVEDRVLWYRVNNVTHNMELYWHWVVGNAITGLTHFTVENRDYLIVSTNQSTHTGLYTLNIYQFELSSREFWIAQRMQLRFACVQTTLLDTGRDLILALPQNDSAAIYTFNPRADDTDYLHFKLKQHIPSENCESIAGFKMGGRSYIAIGGQRPQILLYQQGELLPKTILAHNFGVVELFFPVPVRTYRDDLILLVQHRVDFGTHNVTVLETLIWDGEAFEASIPVPCKLGEHTVYGVSCMLDIQHDAGLRGAAYFRRNDEVSIIVPRRNAESGLFRLHTELLTKNSEYLDLKEIFEFLKKWVAEQDDLITQGQEYLRTPVDKLSQLQPDLSELEELHTPEFVLDSGEVAEIYLNDYRWTDEDTKMDIEQVLTALEQLDAEVNGARARRDVTQDQLNFDYLELDSLNVNELQVKNHNNEEFYVQDGVLDFRGPLNVRELEILESLQARRETGDEVADSVAGNETLIFDGDIEFESINGMLWADLEKNMVFTNQPLNLTELHVDGQVIFEDQLSLNVFNSLEFPNDYLWTSGPTAGAVRAEKIFNQTLSVNALDVEGLLNGMNVSDAITLWDEQDWRGIPTFDKLKVTGSLELNGTMRGPDIDNIPNNPTLKNATEVSAVCNFRQLQVNGPLRVNGTFDGQPLASLLSDIVQRPANPEMVIRVNGRKYFEKIHMPIDLQILDGKVNGIPAEQFVPAHTKQDLEISTLKAYVYFNNLTVSGNFDGVDIEELMQYAVRIDEPQSALNTSLNFVNGLEVKELQIMHSLNGIPIAEGYQTINEPMNIPVAHFEHITVKQANVSGELSGSDNATLNGEKTDEGRQLSKTGDIYIDELKLEQGLEVDKIQGWNTSLIWNFLDNSDDVLEMVLDDKIIVENIEITGNVHVNKLNEQRFDEDLQLTVIWLNRPNYLSTSLTFSEPILIHDELQVDGHYNGRHLPTLINDMVLRVAAANGTAAQIEATKSFTGSVRVLRSTQVEALNGIPFSDIATKRNFCNFRGSLYLHGDLIVRELQLNGALNGYPMSEFNNALRYDPACGAFVLRGVVNFNDTTPMIFDDLTVLGQLNDMSNMSQFFNDLVYKEGAVSLKGNNVFSGRVRIVDGAFIRYLNDLNLPQLFENVVYANEQQPVLIETPLIFENSVGAHNLFVGDSLAAKTLNGNPLEVWFNDTLRLDRPEEIYADLTFAPGTLNGNSFYASYLNDIDLSEIVTLHTPQNLTGNITFSELYLNGEIKVNGTVNGVDLEKEYANTLMMNRGNQHITAPLRLHSALVRGNLQTNAPINSDKDLRQVATLQGDQHFESPLFFKNVTADQLITKYPVSGINMDAWFKAALHTHGKAQQLITGNWSANTLNVKSGPTMPSHVHDFTPDHLPFDGVGRMAHEDAHSAGMCDIINTALRHVKSRGYRLKYLEWSFALEATELTETVKAENATIHTVFPLEQAGASYLLVNAKNLTHLLKWNADNGKYEKLMHYETGQVDQVLPLYATKTNPTAIDFITNQKRAEGMLSYWRLEHSNLRLLKSFEKPATELLHSQTKPSKLYALHEDIVYGYDLNLVLHTDTWLLPKFLDSSHYRFVPNRGHGLMFYNGGMLLVFDENGVAGGGNSSILYELLMRNKRTSAPRYSLPLSYQRVQSTQSFKMAAESLLKPNATQTHQFRLADFRDVIVRVLDDLNYRLRLEVNITQLSIPERDLHDEHLLRDSKAIMRELKQQKIYANLSFDTFELVELKATEDPALILAARTVHILWPNIVDLAEIHGYLQSGNDEQGVATVASIMNELGTTVRDVLMLVNSERKHNAETVAVGHSSSTAAHSHDLAAVVGRIHNLQHQLQTTLRQLKAQQHDAEFAQTPPQPFADLDLEMSDSMRVPRIDGETTATEDAPMEYVTFTLANTTWLKFANKNLPPPGEGEIVSIQVHAQHNPLELLAVTFAIPQTVATHSHAIILYEDVLSNRRFQTIAAHEPHSLISVQLGAETLFAYVERNSRVRVLIYRGVQGFVEFASFESEWRVLKIFTVMLPRHSIVIQQPHLVVAHANGVVFYRFVAAGSLLRMPANLLCN